MTQKSLGILDILNKLESFAKDAEESSFYVYLLIEQIGASSEDFEQYLQEFQWDGAITFHELEEEFIEFSDEFQTDLSELEMTKKTNPHLKIIKTLQTMNIEDSVSLTEALTDRISPKLPIIPISNMNVSLKELSFIDKNDEKKSCYSLLYCLQMFFFSCCALIVWFVILLFVASFDVPIHH